MTGKEALQLLDNKRHLFEHFVETVHRFFEIQPGLSRGTDPAIHSLKHRLKEPSHVVAKVQRKQKSGVQVTPENLFEIITDIAGVRVLHLHSAQFQAIHEAILQQTEAGDWHLFEEPKAYTWDPETETRFDALGIRTELKDSYYTSVHYVVMPKAQSIVKCEIQVRNLFEEIWGEIDHQINYPNPSKSVACREQLKVLAKLSATGSRLADAIFASHADHVSLFPDADS